MPELFDNGVPGKGGYDELLNPKHWFIVVGEGPYRIRNITLKQDLLGEYETKERANAIIKAIAYKNPRFQRKAKT